MQKSIHTVLGFLSQCSQTQKMKTDIAFAIRKWVISCLSNVRTLHLKTDTIKFNKPSVHTFSNLKWSQLNFIEMNWIFYPTGFDKSIQRYLSDSQKSSTQHYLHTSSIWAVSIHNVSFSRYISHAFVSYFYRELSQRMLIRRRGRSYV